MPSNPYLSIVIPAFNREREIQRAIASCQRQSFEEFEVLVVDDASSDRTADVVRHYTDGRIILIPHSRNRGRCAARNTGVRAACGEWVLFLDSDDEYLENAFETIFARTKAVGSEIGRIGFMYELDEGGLSPIPAPCGEVLDYSGYIRWSEGVARSDFHNCVRRSTFARVMLPEVRADEDVYHLQFAKEFLTQMAPDAVALIHSDAANRCSDSEIRKTGVRVEARDSADILGRLLEAHGPALQEWAPKRFETYCRMRVSYHLLAGDTALGLRLACRHIAKFPRSPLSWIIPLIGLWGPRALASAQSFARSRHAVLQRVHP